MGTQKKNAASGTVARKTKAVTAIVRGKGRVTIPEGVRLELDIQEGERFDVSVTADGSILLRRRIEIAPDQAWFWTPAWQARIREGLEDLAAGRSTFYGSTDEFLADLDKHVEAD